MSPLQAVETSGIGVLIGLLGGLFGKGGSAVATPLLRLIGLPAFVSVASPLPATTPGTLVAAAAYWHEHLIDWEVVNWSMSVGIPSTIAGAWMSKLTGGNFLLILTALLVLGFGISFLAKPAEVSDATAVIAAHREKTAVEHAAASSGMPKQADRSMNTALATMETEHNMEQDGAQRPSYWHLRLVSVAISVGLISGLLANSGGFLLAPLYAKFLKLPLKTAFACSLLVAAVLSLPGTIVHWYLGHISWSVAGLVALGSVPLSYLGARLAIRTKASSLERLYGVALTVLGVIFLFHH